MPRYIDADALMKCIPREEYSSQFAVANAPTADVVERKDIEAECELAYKHGWSDCFAEHRWIPVTERLPEAEKKRYWVCTDTGYQCECRWTNNRFGMIESDKWGWSIFDTPQYTEVVAWRELPEPYREETEDADDIPMEYFENGGI